MTVDWNATEDVPEIAELTAPELVTNTIAYSAGVFDATPIRSTVNWKKDLLALGVYGSCIEISRMKRPDVLDASGQGLAIVGDFSRNWG
ncbi:hypothetical protein [Streptosporangium sp. NPDC050280]|uniref:hypothetical protein n=1 Tax=unclassified Streptosporangium TaxID=2632669 RepID=UPI00341E2A34